MKALEQLTADIWEKLPRLIYEDEFELFDESNGYRHTEKLLIPEPPMLNDVLEWLTILNLDNITVEFSNQEFCIAKDNSQVDHYDDDDFEGVIWDLSKPYLKDQSPELIDFLHSLIKTN